MVDPLEGEAPRSLPSDLDSDQGSSSSLQQVSVDEGRLSEAEARRLTQRIQLTLQSVSDQLDKLVKLVREAKATDAHTALGYRSWTEYAAAEFGNHSLRLDREDRRELVALLDAEGMGSRAIAPIAGVSHETVSKDLRQSAVRNLTAEQVIIGRDGRQYPRPSKADFETAVSSDGQLKALKDQLDSRKWKLQDDWSRVKDELARKVSQRTAEVLDLPVVDDCPSQVPPDFDDFDKALLVRDEPNPFCADDAAAYVATLRAAHRAVADLASMALTSRGDGADTFNEALIHEISWLRAVCNRVEATVNASLPNDRSFELLHDWVGGVNPAVMDVGLETLLGGKPKRTTRSKRDPG